MQKTLSTIIPQFLAISCIFHLTMFSMEKPPQKTYSTASTRFVDLPNDILLSVTEFLTPKENVTLRKVCQETRPLIDPSKRIFLGGTLPTLISTTIPSFLINRFVQENNITLFSIIKSCDSPQLLSILLQMCHTSRLSSRITKIGKYIQWDYTTATPPPPGLVIPPELYAINPATKKPFFEKLEHLNLNDTSFATHSLIPLAVLAPQLKSLELHNFQPQDIKDFLSLKDSETKKTIFQKIVFLNLCVNDLFQDPTALLPVKEFPHLKKLWLVNNNFQKEQEETILNEFKDTKIKIRI